MILLSPLAALAILPPLAKPLQQEFGEKTDPSPALLAFSSWSYLMVIKKSAQGLATHQHKENTWSRRRHSLQHKTFQSHSGTKYLQIKYFFQSLVHFSVLIVIVSICIRWQSFTCTKTHERQNKGLRNTPEGLPGCEWRLAL